MSDEGKNNFLTVPFTAILNQKNDRNVENIFFLGAFLRRIFTCACEDDPEVLFRNLLFGHENANELLRWEFVLVF